MSVTAPCRAKRTHNPQECFLCPLIEIIAFKLSKARLLFYLTSINNSIMCPHHWLVKLSSSYLPLETRDSPRHAPGNNTRQHLYKVNPYNNKHWIIDILPELFKVTFIHSECWICTEVMNEMEIWSYRTGPGFFFLLSTPPSYLFVALGQATFFYI